jgi:hypothetical protein
MRLDDINEALGLVGIVPFKPKTYRDPQVTEQAEFLPGSIEARIQEAMKARGWSYNLVCVHPE